LPNAGNLVSDLRGSVEGLTHELASALAHREDWLVAPFLVLLPLLGSSAVKSLLAGRPPDDDAWAAFTEKLLSALVSEQAQTARTLERIEAKLDRLASQTFEVSMGAGHALIRDAQRSWRQGDDANRLLHEARVQYLLAASAAPTDIDQADALVFVGMAWLLMGSPIDTRLALTQAAGLLEPIGRKDFVKPGTWQVLEEHRARFSVLERVWLRDVRGGETSRYNEIVLELERHHDALRREALFRLVFVQKGRRKLGVAKRDARIPSYAPDSMGSDTRQGSGSMTRVVWKP
jgi:hypothetical protein